jgi:hypothetical protein
MCAEYVRDAEVRFKAIVDNRQRGLASLEGRSGRTAEAATRAHNEIFVCEVVRLLRILVNTGRMEEAGKVQRRALVVYHDDKIVAAVQ